MLKGTFTTAQEKGWGRDLPTPSRHAREVV